MFNLDQAIANWRRQMMAGGIKSTEVLDELESHLREDVEQRMRSGTLAERAFEEAVQKVGRADELKLEFGKIELPRPAVSPKLISRGCAATGVFLVLTGMWALSDVAIAERLLGFAWLMLVGGYIAVLPRLNRRIWPGVRGWAFRKAIGTACGFAFMAWIAVALLSCAHINIIHFSSDAVPSLILWPLIYAAVATCLVIGFTTDENALGFWSPAAEQCLVLAQHEALEFHHDFVGTEHILLGLLKSEDGPVAKVLGQMGVRREAVRAEIEKIVGTGPQGNPRHGLVYTPRAKKSMELALQEAGSLRRSRVEAPDLLLGLLREGSGVAALVLKKLGINPENARAELLRMRG